MALAKFTAGESALDRLYQLGRMEGLREQLQLVISGKCHAFVAARNHDDRKPQHLGNTGQGKTRWAGLESLSVT